MMTEIYTKEGGQKDVLLRRTNIKKNIFINLVLYSSSKAAIRYEALP